MGFCFFLVLLSVLCFRGMSVECVGWVLSVVGGIFLVVNVIDVGFCGVLFVWGCCSGVFFICGLI